MLWGSFEERRLSTDIPSKLPQSAFIVASLCAGSQTIIAKERLGTSQFGKSVEGDNYVSGAPVL
jgi:hypothetical protein